MNTTEMRELPPAEIRTEIAKTREKIWKMRFQARGEPMENAGTYRLARKDLARLLTVQREKELGIDSHGRPVADGVELAPATGVAAEEASGDAEPASTGE